MYSYNANTNIVPQKAGFNILLHFFINRCVDSICIASPTPVLSTQANFSWIFTSSCDSIIFSMYSLQSFLQASGLLASRFSRPLARNSWTVLTLTLLRLNCSCSCSSCNCSFSFSSCSSFNLSLTKLNTQGRPSSRLGLQKKYCYWGKQRIV